METEYFEALEIKYETAAAYLIDDGGGEKWIPKSQITDDETYFDGEGEYLSCSLPVWLAEERGMI